MHVRFANAAKENPEFGCDLQRFYPWRGVVSTSNTSWGAALATVKPGESTVPHKHDEHETFIVSTGRACMTVENDVTELSVGDVVYIPPNSEHKIANLSEVDPLQFVTVWWRSARGAIVDAGEFSEAVNMSMTSCSAPLGATSGRAV